jgi:hypothetical protein
MDSRRMEAFLRDGGSGKLHRPSLSSRVSLLHGDNLSVNVNRRHLSQGQRTMAVAVAYPEPQEGKRRCSENEQLNSVHKGLLSNARLVLKYAPDWVDGVLDGSKGLAAAYTGDLQHWQKSWPQSGQHSEGRQHNSASSSSSHTVPQILHLVLIFWSRIRKQ